MKIATKRNTLLSAIVLWGASNALGQDSSGASVGNTPNGEALFGQHCATCHNGDKDSLAPSPQALAAYPPQLVVTALTTGRMRPQGYNLSGSQRRSIAEFVTGESIGSGLTAGQGQCKTNPPLAAPFDGPYWNGWGRTPANKSFQPASAAGLSAEEIPRLKLKWAFGYADSASAWAQPVVAAGRLFVGSQAGILYSLDAKSGCTYWAYNAQTSIRGAVAIGEYKPPNKDEGANSTSRHAIYFGDMTGNAYAVDAQTGEELWTTSLEDHPKARVTGSPTLHDNVLYVPMSSWEEIYEEGYPCCSFRGSLSAVEAHTGEVIWKTYTIDREPKNKGVLSSDGNPLWGPSGSAIWSAPTIDEKRGLVYAATGNSYTAPAINSDALVAFDMATGKIRWVKQTTADDLWLTACKRGEEDECEDKIGPDVDFGTAPMLVTRPDGRELIVIGQKSGIGYAMDPNKEGAIVWQYRAGLGGALGGVEWGSAVDEKNAYFPISDLTHPEPGGLHAVDLISGERAWYAAPPERLMCGEKGPGCNAAQPAGIAVIPGAVFSGSVDGGIRAFSTDDGQLIWEYNTNKGFDTVNEVPARGGSMIGAGPTVVDGVLYVNSGYGTHGGRPGNVLLAFTIE